MYKINFLAKSIIKPLNITIDVNSYLACRRGSSAQAELSPVPCITLNNGCKMPALGLGTWGANDDFVNLEKVGKGKRKSAPVEPDEWVDITKRAIDCGYRHIDTALLYRNEKQIGQAIKEKIKEKVIKREDIFIVTKLWNTFHDPENVIAGCKKSLKNLCLDYVDMYLMHSPMGAPAQKDDNIYAPTKNGKPLFTDTDYVCTWRAMEELVKKGLCKNIGICNFNINQLERLLKYAKIPPQNLQMEHHPYLTQKELTGFCRALKIIITCYAPLGSPNRPWAGKDSAKILLKDPQVAKIAKKYEKSPAQILLKYPIDLGHATIPNPGKGKEHMAENICIFDFCLAPEDIEVLDALNANVRYFKFTGSSGHPHHPFETPKS
ncbi:aldo-keto reductase family 1 member B1-like [Glossina fuscipes fuscipes]